MANTATTQTTALQDQILDLVRQGQDATVKAVQAWSDSVAKLAPALPAVPYAENLPKPVEVLDLGFGFAERLLDNQREFAHSVLSATEPVFNGATKAAKTTK